MRMTKYVSIVSRLAVFALLLGFVSIGVIVGDCAIASKGVIVGDKS
ncbi:MAG: hypothetical protein ND895_26350 [Pyrinomonadaceae bacterium]|nr:hypothetical protein [Pyrinomonadaceae bacterium]